MKILRMLPICLLASAQLCKADLFQQMIGKWKAGGSAGTNITSVYKRYQTKGLIVTTTIIIPGQATGTAVTRSYDNGKIKGFIKWNGIVETIITGTWRVSGKTLKGNVTLSGPRSPTTTQTDKSTLVSANKIISVTTTEQGQFTGSLTRIK